MKWICSQIGAREHYVIPRVLHQAGKLDTLFSDFWCAPGSLWSSLSDALKDRYHSELKDAKVIDNNYLALLWEYLRRKDRDQHLGFLRYGQRFSNQVRDHLALKEVTSETVFFSYDTGFLETGEYVREHGGKCIVGQIDPGETEQRIVREECGRWDGWANVPKVSDEYNNRRRLEWKVADIVLVNSDWSKCALLEQGVEQEKIVVVPLAYEPLEVSCERADVSSPNEPLRVLWLGSVILRKGIQYLVEAARTLESENIIFNVVGPIGISEDARASAPSNIIFHGCCKRSETRRWYANSDVFILPTLSDGFAITQLEAMSHGLPVIVTRCCGDVVTNGQDGFIIPERNSEALAKALYRLANNRQELKTLSKASMLTSRSFGKDTLGSNLAAIEAKLKSRKHIHS